MLIIRKNEVNNLITTVSMNKTLSNPYYLFSFQHIASKERVSFIPEVITTNCRYDKFRFREGGNTNFSVTPPEVYFPYQGQYYYSVYEQLSPTNTNIALAYNKLESGRAVVIVGNDEQTCFFEPYISDDENFSQVIYVSEEEQLCISGDTTPECVPDMTGNCPTFLSRYFPTNSIYYKSGNTGTFLSVFDSCAPAQVAMDDTRLFMVDGCSNYYQYDYSISSGGCFNLSLVNIWDVWPSSGATPNASFTMGMYDSNNLIIGESQQYEFQTGSTLYLYNLTTSGLTKWLEIGNGAQVSNVYYNTGNTQMVLSYASASGGTGYYQLYTGAINPQLVAQIPGTFSNAGSTMYFSGDTPIAVNVAGIQFALDFSASTVTILTDNSGFPIYYTNFGDGFAYMSNIAQKASCYNFNIQPFPVSPTPTPTVTLTSTPTPTVTQTSTPTPTITPSPTTPSDSDATAYLNAVVAAGGTGITSTVSAATINMFISLKNAGLYNKLYNLYPVLGGTAGSSKFNAKNPLDTNAAFRLSFNGGGTFSQAKGYITNAINAYADTHFNPTTQSVVYNKFTMFEYVTIDGNSGYDIGGASAGIYTGIASRRIGNFEGEVIRNNFGNLLSASTTALGTHILCRHNSNSSVEIVKNGGSVTSIPQNTTSTSVPNTNLLIGAYGGVGLYSDKGLSTFGFADGLNNTEIGFLRDIITTFNTTIGR